MADILYLNDGTMRVIFSEYDFIDLLREKIGDDAVKYFDGVNEEWEFELNEQKKIVKEANRIAEIYVEKYNELRAKLSK